MRFGPSARVRARHALFAHDVADASPGRGDALPFQGGLDLPGAVTLAAVAPDRAHVAGDRIRTLRPGMPGHPVVGGAGNVRYPALRRYRVAGGVGPYHACLRANTGAACSETSTSISNRLLRLPGSIGSFRPGVRLSAARVEPLSRMPWTQRRGVDRAMSCPALISRDGLPLSHDCTICRLNASSWWRGCFGPAIVGLQSNDALDLVFEHEREGSALHVFSAVGIHHQQNFPITPGFILRALDHLAGEGRCGHSVADEADDVGAASGQSAGERVVMVAEFVSGPAHLAACGFRDLHVPVVVHRP